jgi:hypothetical protein
VQSTRARRLRQIVGWPTLAAVAGVTLMVGAILTWSTLTLDTVKITRSGVDSGGGGDITGILGLVLLGATALRLNARTARLLGPIALAIGVAVGIVITLDTVVLLTPVGTAGAGPETTIGAGVWVTALGAIIAVIVGIGLIDADWRRKG